MKRKLMQEQSISVHSRIELHFKTGYASRHRVISSVGRALRLHRRCREFESLITHQFKQRLLSFSLASRS